MKVSIFLKYPQHVLITFTLQSQIINHNIYINSSSHDLQWVSYKYHDKRKSPINGLFTPFMKLCLLLKLFFWFDFSYKSDVISSQNRIILIRFCVLLIWLQNCCTQIVPNNFIPSFHTYEFHPQLSCTYLLSLW